MSCHVSFPFTKSGEFEGVTRDISCSGLAVRLGTVASSDPAIGTTARIRVNLPEGPHFPQQCLDCMADVVRVEAGNSGERVIALKVRRIRFGKRELVKGELANSTTEMSCVGSLQ